MKKIIVVLLVVLLTSCATYQGRVDKLSCDNLKTHMLTRLYSDSSSFKYQMYEIDLNTAKRKNCSELLSLLDKLEIKKTENGAYRPTKH